MENTIFRFKVGEFNCVAIKDMLEADLNVLFINTGQQQVVIDPGMGHDCFPGTSNHGLLADRLPEAGISLTDVNLVVFTHADIDHVCGGVDENGKPAFPHARYILRKEEAAFWSSNPERLHPSDAYDEVLREGCRTIPPLRLEQLRPKLEAVDSETEIVPGIRLIATSGHTPGHSLIEITSGADRLWFIGDLFYNPTEIEDPNWYAVFDFDPPQAIATRQRVLAQAAQERIRLMGYHLPFPGLGYVTQQGVGWRWTAHEPESE